MHKGKFRNMSFLKCLPSVFMIEDRYEIIVTLKEKGVVFVRVCGETFYEENSGVLSSEKTFLKISVPQKKLDESKKYEIVYRKTIERKAYFSLLGEEETARFDFKPLKKAENIKIYHIADVHYAFENALRIAEYFGDDTDLFVLNGDVGEVETQENYFDVCKYCGEISRGEVPIVFARGNHDTRGKLAEEYCNYFPNVRGRTYYTFETGGIKGIVLDCGEDKADELPNYGGVNVFHEYRKKQTEFLKRLSAENDGKIVFAICHICPAMPTLHKGDEFDIEQEEYAAWGRELERVGIKFMLCGHYHRAFILHSEDERNIHPHTYPVIVGSANDNGTLLGAGIVLNKNGAIVSFTDKSCRAIFSAELRF